MKKFFLQIIFVLFIASASKAEVVKLNCVFADYKNQEMNIALDFENSLIFDRFGQKRHMEFDDNTITYSSPNKSRIDKSLFTHFLYRLSRLSGNGTLKGYKISDEQFEALKVLIVDEIIMKEVGNLEDKSLDWAREVIYTEKINEYLINTGKQVGSDLLFNCKKAEQKF